MRPEQAADGTRPGTIAVVGVAVVVLSLVIVAISWWVVVPPAAPTRSAAPSMLTGGLFEDQPAGEAIRAAATERLRGYAWVDRAARIARVPIDVAIDAVVADPRLLEAR